MLASNLHQFPKMHVNKRKPCHTQVFCTIGYSYLYLVFLCIHGLYMFLLTIVKFPLTWGHYDYNPQTKVVPLDPKDKEYIYVKNGFDTTIGGPKIIVKIERVQNPTLYAQYAARKKLMDQTNPPYVVNERRLYHGCGGEFVQSIIHGGFNRSYAGRNGKNVVNHFHFAFCTKPIVSNK